MDLPIVVPLSRPVVVGDVTHDKLEIDEPDLATQIAYAELEATLPEEPREIDAARVNLFWIAHLSGVSEAVAGKIKESDLGAVNDAVEKVMGYDKPDIGEAGDQSGNVPPAK